jgi:hypothetical protein
VAQKPVYRSAPTGSCASCIRGHPGSRRLSPVRECPRRHRRGVAQCHRHPCDRQARRNKTSRSAGADRAPDGTRSGRGVPPVTPSRAGQSNGMHRRTVRRSFISLALQHCCGSNLRNTQTKPFELTQHISRSWRHASSLTGRLHERGQLKRQPDAQVYSHQLIGSDASALTVA